MRHIAICAAAAAIVIAATSWRASGAHETIDHGDWVGDVTTAAVDAHAAALRAEARRERALVLATQTGQRREGAPIVGFLASLRAQKPVGAAQ